MATTLPASRRVIVVPGIELPPGESRLVFTASGTPEESDDGTPGDVMFKIENPQVNLTSR